MSSQDSGFTSQDTLYVTGRPKSPPRSIMLINHQVIKFLTQYSIIQFLGKKSHWLWFFVVEFGFRRRGLNAWQFGQSAIDAVAVAEFGHVAGQRYYSAGLTKERSDDAAASTTTHNFCCLQRRTGCAEASSVEQHDLRAAASDQFV